MSALRVRDVMTGPVETIEAGRSLAEARQRMEAGGFRHLPVVLDGRLIGFVSDRDVALVLAAWSEDDRFVGTLADASEIQVREVMVACPSTVAPDDSLDEVLELTIEQKFGAVPVAEGDTVVGIVSTIDLLRLLRDRLSP